MPKLLISYIPDVGETVSVDLHADMPVAAELPAEEIAIYSPGLASGIAISRGVEAWFAQHSGDIHTALQILFGVIATHKP